MQDFFHDTYIIFSLSQEDIDKVKAELEKRQNEDIDESEIQKLKPPLEAV